MTNNNIKKIKNDKKLHYATVGIDMVTEDIVTIKSSIMIYTKLTKTDRSAINNRFVIINENSTNNNMHYC